MYSTHSYNDKLSFPSFGLKDNVTLNKISFVLFNGLLLTQFHSDLKHGDLTIGEVIQCNLTCSLQTTKSERSLMSE